jgi:hypothetical protein
MNICLCLIGIFALLSHCLVLPSIFWSWLWDSEGVRFCVKYEVIEADDIWFREDEEEVLQRLCHYYIFTENDFRLTSILSARGGVSAETSSNAELPISVSVLR